MFLDPKTTSPAPLSQAMQFPKINKQYTKDEKLSLLGFMWRIAFADGKIDVNEEKLIRRLADLIRIKDIDVLKLKNISNL